MADRRLRFVGILRILGLQFLRIARAASPRAPAPAVRALSSSARRRAPARPAIRRRAPTAASRRPAHGRPAAARPTSSRVAPGGVVAGSSAGVERRACARATSRARARRRVTRLRTRHAAAAIAVAAQWLAMPSAARPTRTTATSRSRSRTVGLLLSVVRLGVRLGPGLRVLRPVALPRHDVGLGPLRHVVRPVGLLPVLRPVHVRRRWWRWRRRIQRTARAKDHRFRSA